METLDNFKNIKITTLAGYVLKNFGPMSHLKLQKLLFYCQAYHLAYFKEPLFHEDFEAWVHGPVCRDIYDSLKGKSVLHSDIKYSQDDFDPHIILKDNVSSSQFEVINDVLSSLKDWTGTQLENATHSEKPWLIARGDLPLNKNCSNVISKSDMLEFYSSEVDAWES